METEIEKLSRECAELRKRTDACEEALRSDSLTVKWNDSRPTTYLSRAAIYEVYGVAKYRLLEAERRKMDLLDAEFGLVTAVPLDKRGTTHNGITAGIYSSRFPKYLTEFELVPVGVAPENAGGGSPKIDPEGGLGKSETAQFDTGWMNVPEEDVCRFRIPELKSLANVGQIAGTELGWKVTVDDFEFLAEVELPVKAVLKKVSSTVGDEDFVTAIYLEAPSGEKIQILDEPHSKIEQEFHDAFSEHLARFMEAPEFNAAFHLWKEKASCFERGRQFQRMVA